MTSFNNAETQALVRNVVEGILEVSAQGRKLKGLSTGFEEIDQHIGGLQRGQVTVVTGVRKTTPIVLNIALDVAVRQKVPVLFFSLKQGKEDLLRQMLCAHASVCYDDKDTIVLGKEEQQRLKASAEIIAQAPLYIEHEILHQRGVEGIINCYREIQGVQLLIIDQLDQLAIRLHSPLWKHMLRLRDTGKMIKEVARKASLPVLATTLVSEFFEDYPIRYLSHALLKGQETGYAGEYADNILFLEEGKEKRPHIQDIPVWVCRNTEQWAQVREKVQLNRKTLKVSGLSAGDEYSSWRDLDIPVLREAVRKGRLVDRLIWEQLNMSVEEIDTVRDEWWEMPWNELIDMPDLWEKTEASQYEGAFSSDVLVLLQRARAKRTGLSDREILMLNRTLLDALYPGVLIKEGLTSKTIS